MKKALLTAGLFVSSALASIVMAAQPAFVLSSSSFHDGSKMARQFGGINPHNLNCAGDNISPALSWTAPPEGTKSYVLTVFDTDAGNGAGFNHFIAYGIPAATRGFKQGELSKPHNGYVGGNNSIQTQSYFGPCPPAGPAHHYIFTLYATSLAPDTLTAGLTKEEVLEKIKGQTVGESSIVGRYEHP